jgi:hypothetical protein
MSSASDRHQELRRRFSREPQPEPRPARRSDLPRLSSNIAPPLSTNPSTSSRPSSVADLRLQESLESASAFTTSRVRQQRRRQRRNERIDASHPSLEGRHTSALTIEELDRDLEDANTHLRALLEYTHPAGPFVPPLAPPIMESPSHLQDHAEDSRRVKRRKLDSDRLMPSFNGFKYGHYGQVEAGKLTMEIVSCDGGLYLNESSYAFDNILKDDSTVYCTKGNRCNLVLRHQGATVFSLSELIIKAPGPRSIYSSP